MAVGYPPIHKQSYKVLWLKPEFCLEETYVEIHKTKVVWYVGGYTTVYSSLEECLADNYVELGDFLR